MSPTSDIPVRKSKDKKKKSKKRKRTITDDSNSQLNSPMDKIKKKKKKKRKKIVEVESEPSTNAESLATTKGRNFTVSVALPGSIISNIQTNELRTYVAGQVARCMAIFRVDEVIVFTEDEADITDEAVKGKRTAYGAGMTNPNVFLARILGYIETPQYLRRALFPIHRDLSNAGLLNPLQPPHHLKWDDQSNYREGVVIDKNSPEGQCWVNVGLRRDCLATPKVEIGHRVTVKFEDGTFPINPSTKLKGVIVSPSDPREMGGNYWGYRVRVAKGLQEVLNNSPYEGGYDLTVGTSERGSDAQASEFRLPVFKHMLVVFGGVKGLEHCTLNGSPISKPELLFDLYLNTCRDQGSGTIRTEEAMLVSMSVLHPHILANSGS